MANEYLEKLADTRTLQKVVGAAGYTYADSQINNKPRNIMNSKFAIKNRLTKNNITKTPIKARRSAYKQMEKYWDNGGYSLVKDLFLQNAIPFSGSTDHLPFPPRKGLVWDNSKHRWVRPDQAGKTVIETQGKKRIRGTGTGVHQRTVQTKRGLKRGEARLRYREAGQKRLKRTGR
tara:strand:- start:1223 stop:1750 length:528 start_codon:yes stop_codon:yes gene_type:complete